MNAQLSIAKFAELLEILAADPRGPENEADAAYPEWVRSSVSAAGTKLRVLRHMLASARSEKPALLDVGAQVGAMAAYAARLGFRVAAVDYPNYARRFGAILKPHGVDYHSCDIAREPLPFADVTFDFVTYMDVIEHHSFSPKRVLLEIFRVLRPGGQVIITTPNHASIYNRISLLAGRSVNDDFRYFFEDCAARDFYPGHHREYTRRDLRYALAATGFRVRECKVFDEDADSLRYALRRNGNGSKFRTYLNLGAAWAGTLTGALRLPFGRLLWAVAERPESA